MTKYIPSPFFLKLESTYCLAEWANWKRTSSIFRSIFTKIICLAIMACCLCPVWLFLLSLLLNSLAEGPALTDRPTYTTLAKPILGTTCQGSFQKRCWTLNLSLFLLMWPASLLGLLSQPPLTLAHGSENSLLNGSNEWFLHLTTAHSKLL